MKTSVPLCFTLIFITGIVCNAGEPNQKRPLVGAIRWDAWYGRLPDTTALPDPIQRIGYDPARGAPQPRSRRGKPSGRFRPRHGAIDGPSSPL